MANLYTPFMEKMGSTLGQGMVDRSTNAAIAGAMRGDPQAMQNLYQINPNAAAKVDTMIRQRQASQASATQAGEDRKRKLYLENQGEIDEILEVVKGAETFEQGQAIFNQGKERLRPLIGDEVDSAQLTPEVYEALRSSPGARKFAPKVQMSDQLYVDEGTGELYSRGTSGDPNVPENQWSEQWVGVGHEGAPEGTMIPVSKEGLTTDQKTKLLAHREFLKAEAKGLGTSKAEVATADRVGDARAKIAGMVTGAKIDQQQLGKLKETRPARINNIDKAERFLEAFETGAKSSGIGQQALYFAPIGVWSNQGEFNEVFSAFTEIAARSALKASGEIRPTDADVTGMKRAMFGVGRSEAANIQLLKDYIVEQKALEGRIDELQGSSTAAPSGDQARTDEELLNQY